MLTVETYCLQRAIAPDPDICVRGQWQRVLGAEVTTVGELYLRVLVNDEMEELRQCRFCVLPDGAEVPARWRKYHGTFYSPFRPDTNTRTAFSVFELAPGGD